MKIMIKELKELKKRFGSKRKTKLIEGGDEFIAAKIANQRPNRELQRSQALKQLEENSKIVIEQNHEIKIISSTTIRKLKDKDNYNFTKDLTPPKIIWPVENEPKILAISDDGKIGLIQWEFAGKKPGRIENLLPAGLENKTIINLIPLPKKKNISLGLISSDGRFKRISINEIMDMSNRATTILKLKENIKLKSCMICEENDYIFMISDIGRIIKFRITDKAIPYMGKLAQGPMMMRLFPNENIVKVISIKTNEIHDLIFLSEEGYYLKYSSKYFRLSKKGELGTMIINRKKKKNIVNKLINCFISHDNIYLLTNEGRHQRLDKQNIDSSKYMEESKFDIKFNKNEYIKTIFSTILPEES